MTGQSLESISKELSNNLITPYDTSIPFQIFTTLRYDPKLYAGSIPVIDAINSPVLDESFFYLLKQHIDKMIRAGTYFKFPIDNLSINSILYHLTIALQSTDRLIAHRIKILISKNGEYGIDFHKLPDSHTLSTVIPSYESFQLNDGASIPEYLKKWTGWSLYLDTEPTTPSPFTSFKTTIRDQYNAARERFNIVPGDQREVLLFDSNGVVLEGTITSVAFWRKFKDPMTNETFFTWFTPKLSTGCMDGVIREHLLDTGEILQGVIRKDELQDGEVVLLMNGLMGIKPAKLVLN